MKEYELKESKEKPFFFRLVPKEFENYYEIGFPQAESAHQFKLALALGHYPSPEDEPSKWNLYDKDWDPPIYIPTEFLPDEEPYAGCCQSGCSGCPTYRGPSWD
jgi:hypothetical protein